VVKTDILIESSLSEECCSKIGLKTGMAPDGYLLPDHENKGICPKRLE
jgi:hypothetical protein